jgi:hypothetical protein
MARACSSNGEKWYAYRMLFGKSEGKRPLERLRRRWVDNVKTDLRWIVCGGMDWIDLAEDRNQWKAVVNNVRIFRLP